MMCLFCMVSVVATPNEDEKMIIYAIRSRTDLHINSQVTLPEIMT